MSEIYIDEYHERLEQDIEESDRLIWELCGGNYKLLEAGRKVQESLKQFTVQPDSRSLVDEIEDGEEIELPF